MENQAQFPIGVCMVGNWYWGQTGSEKMAARITVILAFITERAVRESGHVSELYPGSQPHSAGVWLTGPVFTHTQSSVGIVFFSTAADESCYNSAKLKLDL